MPERPHHYRPVDRLIGALDRSLRTLFPPASAVPPADQPGAALPEAPLAEPDRRLSASLMRVNHAGEICAQALYLGQAGVAREPRVRRALETAAGEETAHLRWCEQRLAELGGRTSRLNPLWYAGAYTLGCVAGLAGDRWSLGFVAETERQVERHLDGHLARLPAGDARSRAIVDRMREDERRHGESARAAGGAELPRPARALMALQGRLMTTLAHWI